MFGRKRQPKSEPVDLHSGGWVDLAECELLWSHGNTGERLWRSPKDTLVMRWAERYVRYNRAGISVFAQVDEWRVDSVTEEFARDLMVKRDHEGFITAYGGVTAKRLFPGLFHADRDPKLKR